MANHPLLQKRASDSQSREDLNKELENARAMKKAKAPAWKVTIRSPKDQTRVEKVEGANYRVVERKVAPTLRSGEAIQSVTVAAKKASEEKKPGSSRFLTIAEVKAAYARGVKEGRFVETAEGIRDTKDDTFLPWSPEEAERWNREIEQEKVDQAGTGDYEFYSPDPGSPAAEEWIAKKQMGIQGAVKKADQDNPMCDCGHRRNDHNEKGLCDICGAKCPGFDSAENSEPVKLGAQPWYGKGGDAPAGAVKQKNRPSVETLARQHKQHEGMCDLSNPVCKAYTDMRIADPGWWPGRTADAGRDWYKKHPERMVKYGPGDRPVGHPDREMEQEHPGAVCSDCGRTVTNGEYSYGGSNCCKADVVAEEEYGKTGAVKAPRSYKQAAREAGPLRFGVPEEFQEQVAKSLFSRGMEDFQVLADEFPHLVFFQFSSEPEYEAAVKIIRHDFKNQIQGGKGLWSCEFGQKVPGTRPGKRWLASHLSK
jgi:hypothetical protein